MAPQANQDKIKAFVRTAYEEAIVKLPNTTQLDAKPLVAAFDMWDKLVGSKVKK
jgi:putative spermidine/putrescine transport system substrate-binding protein